MVTTRYLARGVRLEAAGDFLDQVVVAAAFEEHAQRVLVDQAQVHRHRLVADAVEVQVGSGLELGHGHQDSRSRAAILRRIS
jgi:hypothetical protein